MTDKVEINGVTYVEESVTASSVDSNGDKYLIGQYVIVRCRDAGVHSGTLVDYKDRTVILKNSRRLWYWKCKINSFLSGVAVNGITDESKVGESVPTLILTESCEIIEASKDAEESIVNSDVVSQE